MSQLFRLFIAIAFLKKGPQDVPYSLPLFIFLFILIFVLEFILLQIPNAEGKVFDTYGVLRYLGIANSILLTVYYLVFRLHGYANRFLQSITAITGVEVLQALIRLPVIYLMVQAAIAEDAVLLTLMFYLQVILLGWMLMIYMHTFRIGLARPGLYAGVLALSMFSLNLLLNYWLFPEAH